MQIPENPDLCIVGPMPPPMHGVSTINQAMLEFAEAKGMAPICFNTAPASLSRSLRVRLGRISRVIRAITGVKLYAKQTRRTVYLSLSGGLGLIWEAILALQARRHGARVVVHHHSFRYLDEPYWPMKLLVWAAGSGTLHITLGRMMAERLKQFYPSVGQVLILSNAGFVSGAGGNRAEVREPKKVGFLSNLSAAKGLDDFLALAESSSTHGMPWRFIMAGPFESDASMERYLPRIQELSNLEYRGPLYTEAKGEFFREIDVFAFPTHYKNEAEPLVVLEALSHGDPVIAFGRGCIAEMLGERGGQVIPVGTGYVGFALKILEAWHAEGDGFRRRCAHARQRFEELQTESTQALQRLMKEFSFRSS